MQGTVTTVRPRERGFTLLEALVAVAIFSVVMVGVVKVYATGGNLFNRGEGQAESQQNARVALEAAARELRMAGYDHSGVIAGLTNPTAIQSGGASDLTFVADVTGDGTVDRVNYALSGGKLVRSISSWGGSSFPTATSGDVADGVTQLSYTYYDSANAAISAPVAAGSLANIRRITISLTSSTTIAGVQQDYPIVVDVNLRN